MPRTEGQDVDPERKVELRVIVLVISSAILILASVCVLKLNTHFNQSTLLVKVSGQTLSIITLFFL